MKLKLTPTRISLLALGAFAALVAQELVRSDAKTSNVKSSDSKSKANQSPTEPLLGSSRALAQPEAIAAPVTPIKVAPKPQTTKPAAPSRSAIAKAPRPAMPAAPTVKIQPPPPPTPLELDTAQPTSVSVGGLPIDSIVSETLKTANSTKALSIKYQAPDRSETTKTASTSNRQKPQAQAKAPTPTPSPTKTIASTKSAVSAALPKLASAALAPAFSITAGVNAQTPPPPPSVPTSSMLVSADPADDADADSYTLGAGDKVRVDILNVPEYSKEYQVLVNGSLNLHRAGNLRVAGMTIKQAEQVIATRYRRVLKQPTVDLSLISARPLNVAIAGEIGKPGTYALTFGEGGKFPTVTKLIREAGGMNRSANPRQVVLRRAQRSGGDQEIRLNLWELFQTGNIRQDVALRDGDSVFIPAASEVNLAEAAQFADANFSNNSEQPLNVAVVGEVMRPGPHTLKTKTPTLTQAIQEAGGIKQLANLKEIKVRRATRSGAGQTINVNLWELLKTGNMSQDLVLQQGDTIEVPQAVALSPEAAAQIGSASFAPAAIKVNVVGEVTKPGVVEVPLNTPLNQALLSAGGFTRQAKRKNVELIRLNPNGTASRQSVQIDLARGIDSKNNPMLQNGDVIVVDRSGAAKFSDSLDTILNPIGKLNPLRFLFGF
jgi:polysaccharide export outer membrane protein